MNNYQKESYQNLKYTKFLYGRQITMLNNYIKGIINENDDIYNLIYYITRKNAFKKPKIPSHKSYSFFYPSNYKSDDIKNNDSENINFNRSNTLDSIVIPTMEKGTMEEYEATMKNMYNSIENYLAEIMNLNNIKEKNLFEDSIIKNKNYSNEKNRGFYITNAGNNIYQLILKYYHTLVGNSPPRYSLLLCNEETTIEEIMSFMYLTIFCPFHSLFIVANCDRLNLDIVYEVENMIEKFYDNRLDIKTYILFLFNDIGNSEIGKEILKICQKADDPKEDSSTSIKKMNNKEYYKNIEIITSSRAGLGKTFYIKKKCAQEGLKYISFQIGGEVKRKTIMRRLKNLNLKNGNYGLHIDFSDTKQIELFEDFIFSFLVQKFYSNNEDIFCYGDNIKIYVEIPNGFFNFMKKFKILNEFSIHEINDLQKFELTITKDLFQDFKKQPSNKKNNNNEVNQQYLYQSDVQMVCNYLKNYDKMSEKNLYFKNLNQKLDSAKYYCDSEFINEDECDTLLNKYFNKKNRSYHQIYIYIKILADQLRRFSNDYYLMIQTLMATKVSGEIRKDIIQAFMDLTTYFTVGAFD